MNLKQFKIYIIILTFVAISIFTSNVFGASVDVSVGYSTITVGGSTTMTITGNDAIGKISVTSSDSNVVSVSQSSIWLEGSASVTLTTKSVGSATITISSVDMSDSSGNAVSISRSVGITVKPVYIDTRSTNNNLSSLSVGDEYKFAQEFSKDTLWYGLEVPNTVTKLDVIATAEDSKASVNISGNQDFKVGIENYINIDVTAENETTKTYHITVIRKKDPNDENAELKSLEFAGCTLRNKFDKNQYYYLLEDIYADVDSIKVSAVPEIDGAKVEIAGNRNLKNGLNVIEIKVTSKDESMVKNTRVEVFKKDEVLKLVDTEEKEEKKTTFEIIKENIITIIIGLIAILELVIIVILLLRNKSNKKTSNNDYPEDKKDSNKIDRINPEFSYSLMIDSVVNKETTDEEKNDDSARRHRRNRE